MAYSKTYPRKKASTRRRTVRRKTGYRKRIYNTSKAFGRPMSGPVVNLFPNSLMRKLKYVDTVTINPASASRARHVFRSNGMYDPDVTGTGHQPRGFDEIMAAYYNFHVIASKITVTQLTSVTSVNGYVFLAHDSTGDPLSGEANDSSAFECTSIVSKPTVLADTTGNTRKFKVSRSVKHKQYFKSKILSNPNFTGTVSNDPTTQAYWTIYYQNIQGGDPDSMGFLVEVEYIAVFTNPRQIGSS